METLLILGRMKLCVKASLLRERRPSAASTLLMNFRQKLKQLWSSSWNLREGQTDEKSPSALLLSCFQTENGKQDHRKPTQR